MPSQVDANFINMRSREIPASSYRAIKSRAFFTDPSLSKDSLASTSVETLLGTISSIFNPKLTANLSIALLNCTVLSLDLLFA